MTTRILAITALALWALTVAGGAWLFFRGYTQPSADGRTAVVLAPAERERVLAEMRTMLASVQGVVAAQAAEQRSELAAAARRSGTGAVNLPPTLMAKIPQPFMQMGMGVHRSFDEIAAAAEDGAPWQELGARLGTLLANCVACHAAYRFESAGAQ